MEERDYRRDPTPYRPGHKRYSILPSPGLPWENRPMPKGVPIVLISIFGLLALIHGIDARTLGIFGAGSALILLAYYFESRPRHRPATAVESATALVWRVFRTVIGLLGALAFMGAAVLPAMRREPAFAGIVDVLSFCLLLLLGLACCWWALIGNAWGLWDADLRAYREQKRRYHWPF